MTQSTVRRIKANSDRFDALPKDMEPEYLINLAFQLYARALMGQCSQELHNRAMELKDEVKRRLCVPY